jgi:hypothetical protein
MIRCRHYPPVTTLPDLTVLNRWFGLLGCFQKRRKKPHCLK